MLLYVTERQTESGCFDNEQTWMVESSPLPTYFLPFSSDLSETYDK